MFSFNIIVKVFKKRSDGSLSLYFVTNSRLVSGLLLSEVYSLVNSHYIDILTPSPNPFLLEVRVDSKKECMIGKTKINY